MANLTKAPGQRWLKRLSTRTKWLLLAPVSLVLIGFGLSVFGEATYAKHSGAPTTSWVLWGTYSLILINGGLSLLGEAIRLRVRLDTRKVVRRELRRRARFLTGRDKKKRPNSQRPSRKQDALSVSR
jgi:hypothetical protein